MSHRETELREGKMKVSILRENRKDKVTSKDGITSGKTKTAEIEEELELHQRKNKRKGDLNKIYNQKLSGDE